MLSSYYVLNPKSRHDSIRTACSDLKNTTEQSPSCEADSLSASQETPRLLWNPKFHCIQTKQPLGLILSHWTLFL